MDKILNQYFTFIEVTNKLKEIERYKGMFFWKDYPFPKRYDSVADHTWRLAMMIILFSDKLSKPINLEKALQITLLHDIQEVISGDDSPLGSDGTGQNTYAFNDKKAKERSIIEVNSAKELFKLLPSNKAKELLKIWELYEKQDSFEARVVKSLDKIEALLQILEWSKGELYEEHLEFSISYAMKLSNVDPFIKKFGEMVVEELRKQYKEFKPKD